MTAESPQVETLTERVDQGASAINLKEQKDKLIADGYKVNAILMKGKPVSDIILKAAEIEKADTIIMCTHGLTGWKRQLFGSVAEKVIGHSQIPVLLIRPSEIPD